MIVYYSSEHRFELVAFGRDCSGTGKETLSDIVMCKAAANVIGMPYKYDDYWNFAPKGCFANGLGFVFWNNEKIGGVSTNARAICKCKYLCYQRNI